jgi:hypothetical protein
MLNKIKDIKNEIKWAYQRVKYGYDERVTWSIDYYLCEYIPIWIRKIKNHGHPIKTNQKEWNDTLESIAVGFESGLKMLDSISIKNNEYKEWNKKFDEGMENFIQYFFQLWT